ncbi:unnamed protein product [Cylicostephanus goldi]|uniref:Uncharacterized protein n=1 Tax=Cylicostephanus goldi TaxID=71465 RepID=A0A3P6S797_CYLGO|nr:unnamed protein product [Cylicostephanus goldi]
MKVYARNQQENLPSVCCSSTSKENEALPKRKNRTAVSNSEAEVTDNVGWPKFAAFGLFQFQLQHEECEWNSCYNTPTDDTSDKGDGHADDQAYAHLIRRTPAVRETITADDSDDSKSTRTISTRKKRRGRGVK